MTEPLVDVLAVARVARAYRLVTPRSTLAGRLGGVVGVRPGGSIELHDFREYQPGDDIRQLDWNAAARSDQLIVRVRREEISPRVELVIDASRSMAVTPEKARRVRELALLLVETSRAAGQEPTIVVAGEQSERFPPGESTRLANLSFEGRSSLAEVLHRSPPLRSCGVRVVVSDFLFATGVERVIANLAEGTAVLGLVQVLDASDREPSAGGTIALTDSESGEQLERELGERVLEGYRRRFRGHQASVAAAATRSRAVLCELSAGDSLEVNCRSRLFGRLLEARP